MKPDEAPQSLGVLKRQISTNGNWSIEARGPGAEKRLNEHTIEFRLICIDTVVAVGRLESSGIVESLGFAKRQRGVHLQMHDQTGGAWGIVIRPMSDGSGVVICERATVSGKLSLSLLGTSRITHNQLRVRRLQPGETVRVGAFTQHGQLLDLRDWVMAEADGQCSGFLGLRVGRWRSPVGIFGDADSVTGRSVAQLPLHTGATTKRSYAITYGPAAECLAEVKPNQHGVGWEEDYAIWPAERIAANGFARGERIVAERARSVIAATDRAKDCIFGGMAELRRAITMAEKDPALSASHEFWRGDYHAAWERAIHILRTFRAGITSGGFLHPIGNPVASRELAPAATVVHLLDCLGGLSIDERREAAEHVGVLANLLMRTDFYPYHLGTKPPEYPYGPASLYRGMLNQNFNTDRYVMVGLAGCLLPNHPHAVKWRAHAASQFYDQMRAWVWPGGAWEESHTYANHVKLTLLPLVMALRHGPDGVNLMADERFIAMCRFFISLLSPPDQESGGRRRVPAIGDHGYLASDCCYLYAWLARLDPAHSGEYSWAWREAGAIKTEARTQTSVFSPLLLPPNIETLPAEPPAMPTLMNLAGYGAVARTNFGAADESLLIVRCGQSWGHYHFDQGSFWWWSRGVLICADSGLGNGPMKFLHTGHNVLGYVGRTPMQFLDRVPYAIESAVQADDQTTIRCSIPVHSWHMAGASDMPIDAAHRPHVTREFAWRSPDRLEITDTPTRSPKGLLQWNLHVIASGAEQTGPREVTFTLKDHAGAMLVALPSEPAEITITPMSGTIHLCCMYPDMPLVHRLSHLTSVAAPKRQRAETSTA